MNDALNPSNYDCDRIVGVEIDGRVDSEVHTPVGPVWTLFRYPLSARHKQHGWPYHFLLVWNAADLAGYTDALVTPGAVVAYLKQLAGE